MNRQHDFRDEYNKDLKRKIHTAVDNIGGYTREEMFTLEFVSGALKKYIPENYNAESGVERKRKEITELLSSIDNAWILDQIKRTMHQAYLEDMNPLLLNHLILTGRLHTYLADLNEQAQNRCRLIIRQMAAAEGVTEMGGFGAGTLSLNFGAGQ